MTLPPKYYPILQIPYIFPLFFTFYRHICPPITIFSDFHILPCYDISIKKYISHISAAFKWNIPHLNEVLGAEITNKYQPSDITDITVTEPSRAYLKKGYRIHSRKLPLPRGSIVIKDGELVASPELIFLDLANILDIHRLIFLGLQMCSHPVGKPQSALTSKWRIIRFLNKMQGFNGYNNAILASKYLENGSASIMESIVYMILTLPHSLGGYGLKGAVFNHEIPLGKRGEKLTGQTRYYVDLYYKESKQAIEYDSFKFHNSPLAQHKDHIRSSFLYRKRIKVSHLTTAQLYDESECRKFAFKLGTLLGKRIRIRAKGFVTAHKSLRKLLP